MSPVKLILPVELDQEQEIGENATVECPGLSNVLEGLPALPREGWGIPRLGSECTGAVLGEPGAARTRGCSSAPAAELDQGPTPWAEGLLLKTGDEELSFLCSWKRVPRPGARWALEPRAPWNCSLAQRLQDEASTSPLPPKMD